MKNRKLHKKILFWVIMVPVLIMVSGIGLLIYPGWSAGPLVGLVEDTVEEEFEGLICKLDRVILRLSSRGMLKVEVGGLNLDDVNGDPTFAVNRVSATLPLARLIKGKVMPEEVKVNGFEVWVRVAEDGTLLLPSWVSGFAEEAAEPADKEQDGRGWLDMELSKLPAMLRLESGDRFEIGMEDYAAHLLRGEGESSFVLPSLYVNFDGRSDGVDISWSSVGWESAGAKLVSGSMGVNVFEEEIIWKNQLNLPLTPALADWLRAGFPFLPIPPFLQTGVHLSTEGTVDVRGKRMALSGQLELAAGRLVLPNTVQLSLGIPAVGMEFGSEMGIGGGLLRLTSDLTVRIGEGEGAAHIRLNANVDGANDLIAVESLGFLSGLDELLALLPEDYRPVQVHGDLRWQARVETVYSAPAAIRIGSVELSSGGIEIGFAGRLENPLRIDSFSFGGRVEQAGKHILVAPFHFNVGPLRIRGTGLEWLSDGELRSSEGVITLEPFRMAEILSEIPAGLLQFPEELSRFVDTVELEHAQLGIEIGHWREDEEAFGILLSPEWHVLINGSPLNGGGRVWARLQQPLVEWDLLLAKFNPMDMGLPYLDAYGRLNSNVSARILGDIKLEGMVANNRIELAASRGAIVPAEGLEDVLAVPVPVGNFHCVANFGYSNRMLDFSCVAEASSGLGGFRFEVDAEPFNISELGSAQLALSAGVRVDPADTADLLELLNPNLLADLPLTHEELADFALDAVSGSLVIRAAELTASVPQLIEMKLQGDLHFLMGAEPISINGSGGFSPEEEILSFEWKVPTWNIARSNLKWAERLSIPLEALQLPARASGAIQLPFRNDPKNFKSHLNAIRVDVLVEMDGASIGVNPYLASVIDIPSASFQLNAAPILSLIESVHAGMTLMGGEFFLESTGLRVGKVITGNVSAGIRGLSFDWIPGCIPMDLIPVELQPFFDDLVLLGQLEQADLLLEFGDSNSLIPLPMVTDFNLSTDLRGLGVRHKLIPTIDVEHLEMSARPDQIRLEVLNAGNPLAMLSKFGVVVDRPLSQQPVISIATSVVNDTVGLREVLDLVHEGESIQALVEQFGIDGVITHEVDARLQMDPAWVEFNLAAKTDLEQFAVQVNGLSRTKVRGEDAGINTRFTGRVGLPAKGEGTTVELAMEFRDLFLDYFEVALGAIITPDFEGPYGGLNSADFHFSGMDYSDLEASLQVLGQNTLKLEVLSRQLNLGPLLQLIEPAVVAALNRPEGDSGEVGSDPTVGPIVESEDAVSGGLGNSLPVIELVVELNRIQFGNAGSVGPFRMATELRDSLPSTLEFEFASGEEWIRFAFQPEGNRRNFFFNLSNLGHWIRTAVVPLHVFTSTPALQNSTLAMAKRLPEFFANGDLSFDGFFALDPSPEVLLSNLSLAGLVLQSEVPFLSRIAALVNRSVVLQIPFTEFRFATIEANPQAVHVKDGYMDGPINLAISKVEVDVPRLHVLFQGKVFGVAFEVIGAPPDLQFYLQEKGAIIKSITTEDDFEW